MPSRPAAGRPDEQRPVARASWLGLAASALLSGLLLAVILIALVPARTVVDMAEPRGLVLPMLSGVHAVERDHGIPIRWTNGRARMRWLGRYGADPVAVVVRLAGFPGRGPDHVEIDINGQLTRHPITDAYADVRVELPPGTRAPLDIVVAGATMRSPGDERLLGVRLQSVAIEHPSRLARLARAELGTWGIGIVAFGAIAWLVGAWAAGAGASGRSRWRAACLAWSLAACAAAMLAPTALRADTALMLAPVATAFLAIVLLARAGHARWVAACTGLVLAAQGMVIVTWCASAFVDVPRWDIWEIVPLIDKQQTSGITLGDLWAPHNEHRPLVARAVLLANVALARWNHWNELWLILSVTAAHVLLLVAYLRRLDPARSLETLIVVAGIGTFVATATQWENYLQGWQVALIIGAMGISGAFLLLSVGPPSWARLAGAAACVTVGVAGFASCLLGWPLGAVAIVARRQPGWAAKLLGWLACSAVVVFLFAHGFVRPPAHPTPAPIFTSLDALQRVAFGLCLAVAMPVWYVAEPFVPEHASAPWVMAGIGAVAVTLAVVLMALHLRRGAAADRSTGLFPTLLVLFSLGATGVAAIGRVPLGLHAMTASRYIVFTALFWIGLLFLLTVATPLRAGAARAAGALLALVIVVAGMRAWADSLPQFEAHYVAGSLGREALLRADWPNTLAIYPVPPVLDERRQYLQRHGLSVYRPGSR